MFKRIEKIVIFKKSKVEKIDKIVRKAQLNVITKGKEKHMLKYLYRS